MRGIYLAAAGLRAEQARAAAAGRRLNNLEAAGLPGEVTVLTSSAQAFHRMDAGAGTAVFLGPGPGLVWPAPELVPELGVIRSTGVATDLAIEGPGFFVVAGADGEFLTRNGCFGLDGEGYLTAIGGYRVLGEAGPIRVDETAFTVNERGEVRVGSREAGRLLLEVPGTDLGPALPGGIYRRPPTATSAGGESRVMQGALEYPKHDHVGEVVALMTALRGYEAAQRATQAHDEAVRKLLESLGIF
ncbi:MAG: flagellar basal body rod C-terminal domain-containing protein [bacterium]|nr:flagellar basal body rod C-terminal domain-containing protein [bacterium]